MCIRDSLEIASAKRESELVADVDALREEKDALSSTIQALNTEQEKLGEQMLVVESDLVSERETLMGQIESLREASNVDKQVIESRAQQVAGLA